MQDHPKVLGLFSNLLCLVIASPIETLVDGRRLGITRPDRLQMLADGLTVDGLKFPCDHVKAVQIQGAYDVQPGPGSRRRNRVLFAPANPAPCHLCGHGRMNRVPKQNGLGRIAFKGVFSLLMGAYVFEHFKQCLHIFTFEFFCFGLDHRKTFKTNV